MTTTVVNEDAVIDVDESKSLLQVDELDSQSATVLLTHQDWQWALKRVRHGICKEEARYYLNGAYLTYDANEHLRFAATDGHRLIEVIMQAGTDSVTGFQQPVILPADLVSQIIKATAARRDQGQIATLTIAPVRGPGNSQCHRLTFQYRDQRLEAMAIDGTFPDYQRVIPQGDPAYGIYSFERKELQKAVEALTGFGSGRGNRITTIRFNFAEKQAVLSFADGDEQVSASVIVKTDHNDGHKTPVDVGFDGRYVADFLRAETAPCVAFHYYGPNESSRWEAANGAVEVIMPLRVSSIR